MQEHIFKKIGSIVFGFLSPDIIRKMAAVKVVTPELYDKEGYSVDGGLMDTHLGVIDPGLRCATCGGKLKECPGHFGYIELARPIIHIKYRAAILDVLRTTCRDCGKLLMTEEEKNKGIEDLDEIERERGITARRKAIRTIINKIKNIKKCPHCEGKQYTIKIDKPSNYYERDKRLSPTEVRYRLEKVSDSDIVILGFNPQLNYLLSYQPHQEIYLLFPVSH